MKTIAWIVLVWVSLTSPVWAEGPPVSPGTNGASGAASPAAEAPSPGPTDAGPTDAGPTDAGPTDAGPTAMPATGRDSAPAPEPRFSFPSDAAVRVHLVEGGWVQGRVRAYTPGDSVAIELASDSVQTVAVKDIASVESLDAQPGAVPTKAKATPMTPEERRARLALVKRSIKELEAEQARYGFAVPVTMLVAGGSGFLGTAVAAGAVYGLCDDFDGAEDCDREHRTASILLGVSGGLFLVGLAGGIWTLVRVGQNMSVQEKLVDYRNERSRLEVTPTAFRGGGGLSLRGVF